MDGGSSKFAELRGGGISKSTELVGGGSSKFDVFWIVASQGMLNCWVVAAQSLLDCDSSEWGVVTQSRLGCLAVLGNGGSKFSGLVGMWVRFKVLLMAR